MTEQVDDVARRAENQGKTQIDLMGEWVTFVGRCGILQGTIQGANWWPADGWPAVAQHTAHTVLTWPARAPAGALLASKTRLSEMHVLEGLYNEARDELARLDKENLELKDMWSNGVQQLGRSRRVRARGAVCVRACAYACRACACACAQACAC